MEDKKAEEVLLVEGLKRGDERVVGGWFKTYQARLEHYILRKVSDREDAQELAQEVFVNCLRNIANFSGKSSLWTWMCAIANHEVMDFYRKKYAKKVIRTLPLGEALLANFEQYNDEHIERERMAMLRESIDDIWGKIKEGYKELLTLKYVDKKKVREIAQMMGRTTKAVEADLWRARRDFVRAYKEKE
ncbi:sigma-70 family RNA polymerase sigma factor [Microgenomates group bacterium]|nr:sigma-70 family RNA polymerase sigma factor [Microgenomates group bacterium]